MASSSLTTGKLPKKALQSTTRGILWATKSELNYPEEVEGPRSTAVIPALVSSAATWGTGPGSVQITHRLVVVVRAMPSSTVSSRREIIPHLQEIILPTAMITADIRLPEMLAILTTIRPLPLGANSDGLPLLLGILETIHRCRLPLAPCGITMTTESEGLRPLLSLRRALSLGLDTILPKEMLLLAILLAVMVLRRAIITTVTTDARDLRRRPLIDTPRTRPLPLLGDPGRLLAGLLRGLGRNSTGPLVIILPLPLLSSVGDQQARHPRHHPATLITHPLAMVDQTRLRGTDAAHRVRPRGPLPVCMTRDIPLAQAVLPMLVALLAASLATGTLVVPAVHPVRLVLAETTPRAARVTGSLAATAGGLEWKCDLSMYSAGNGLYSGWLEHRNLFLVVALEESARLRVLLLLRFLRHLACAFSFLVLATSAVSELRLRHLLCSLLCLVLLQKLALSKYLTGSSVPSLAY